MPGQLGNQLVGVLISWGLAIVGSLVLLKVTDMLVGLRVTRGGGGSRASIFRSTVK